MFHRKPLATVLPAGLSHLNLPTKETQLVLDSNVACWALTLHVTLCSVHCSQRRFEFNRIKHHFSSINALNLCSVLSFIPFPHSPNAPVLSPLWLRGYTISTYWCGCEHDRSRVMVLCRRAGSPWDLSGYLLFGVSLFCFVFIFFGGVSLFCLPNLLYHVCYWITDMAHVGLSLWQAVKTM